MSEIIIKRIDKEYSKDARLANEPFKQWGRMIPYLEYSFTEMAKIY